jgi:uncharacterized protein (TIGR02594 family)
MKKLFEKALEFYGLKEISGGKHNKVIVDFFAEIGHEWVKDDETAWCSAFVNYICKISGFEYTKKLNARSWLEAGWKVETPQLGDIVVFWRESKDSWKGHVAFYVHEDSKYIWVLGGNQGNKVQISAYPKERLLEYRRLKSY